MKGVLLSGGTGSRLRPITHTGPKQLVPVANKPVLEYAVEDFKEAGITEIGVILGNRGRDEIKNTSVTALNMASISHTLSRKPARTSARGWMRPRLHRRRRLCDVSRG